MRRLLHDGVRIQERSEAAGMCVYVVLGWRRRFSMRYGIVDPVALLCARGNEARESSGSC